MPCRAAAAAAAKSLQSCPTLCYPIDGSPPGPAVPGCIAAICLHMNLKFILYWSGLPLPSPGDLPDPGIKPTSPVTPGLEADSLPLSHQGCLRQKHA